MAIYVDEMRYYATRVVKQEARKHGNEWCHMWTDGDIEELHQFAEHIGLKRSWFQNSNTRFPHYDLTPNKQLLAMQYGAIFMPLLDWVKQQRETEAERTTLFELEYLDKLKDNPELKPNIQLRLYPLD